VLFLDPRKSAFIRGDRKLHAGWTRMFMFTATAEWVRAPTEM
jgi:hypothetical protein